MSTEYGEQLTTVYSDLSCGEPSMSCAEKASASKKSPAAATSKKRLENWISQYDKERGTVAWLKYDTTGRTNVAALCALVLRRVLLDIENFTQHL